YALEGDTVNAGISFSAAIPGIGWGATSARWGKRAADIADKANDARKARGGATTVRKGQQGEAAVRAIKDIGPKKPIVVNGRRRIPDGMNRTTLTEIKNVKSLSYTQQLRDYADYANENGLVFELWMPRGVEMSRTLRDEIDAGRIVPQWIPGT
ncbi:MAG: putative toxin, partial [Planctomycetota bacterium]|nr:putative toxin [Planctomycetota bacterium]